MHGTSQWWPRLVAAVSGAVLALVVPAHAWAASTGADALVIEAARSRRRGGIGLFGILGAGCCLVVVIGIVVAVVLIAKKRRR